jgi:hypothetical protein
VVVFSFNARAALAISYAAKYGGWGAVGTGMALTRIAEHGSKAVTVASARCELPADVANQLNF